MHLRADDQLLRVVLRAAPAAVVAGGHSSVFGAQAPHRLGERVRLRVAGAEDGGNHLVLLRARQGRAVCRGLLVSAGLLGRARVVAWPIGRVSSASLPSDASVG
eukprot:6997738-Alexandrium_andersonii.AAC.1